ncbi:hypothetical protein HN873_060200 [Arachis hypogaea]
MAISSIELPYCKFLRWRQTREDSSFLFMGRLLEDFGVCIISYVVLVYIAEISPQNMRGTLGSVNQLSITIIGIMLAYLLGLFVNWRTLAVLGSSCPNSSSNESSASPIL